ncbi:MAG TPA: hypothetical protein VFN85_01160, partial [Solirubrobacterales bacterium]|nr:hypothetical protein [Solirubrobacterales bacterium]
MLDPRLSLIGGCHEETLDPVEDPGCPTTPPAAEHPPAGFFSNPSAVATNVNGDIFVASKGKNSDGSEGRIDIFSPEGSYLSETAVSGPQALAIDSTGVLYVWSASARELLRFEPCGSYDPAAGQIEYCAPVSVPSAGPECPEFCNRRSIIVGLAIDRADGHPFINFGGFFVEYGSAAEENEEIRTDLGPEGTTTGFVSGLGLDSARRRLYVQEGTDKFGVYELAAGLPAQEEYAKIETIEAGASGVPGRHFGAFPTLAVDEGTGNLFVYDTDDSHLWELGEHGNYLATVEFPLQAGTGFIAQIAVDNGPASPNGKLSEEEGRGRYLYVPSYPKEIGHSFAFFVSKTSPPEVKTISAANISVDEAGLHAQIDPNNLQTTYTFDIKVDGTANWSVISEGTLPAGNLDAKVSAAARALSPDTHYRFRVLATNQKGSDEEEGSFATYPDLPLEPSPCPNALLRTGLSALLPDCRAYELVTPPDTNARAPLGAEYEGGGFTSPQVSPAGDKVPFRVEGGTLPGLGGTGGLKGDPYLATRTPTGWSTAYTGPSAAEAVAISPGTTSPDQGYSFWEAAAEGSASLSNITTYVRYPDGHSELVGRGTLGVDPEVSGKLISEGGGHIVFTTGTFASSATAIQIEPDAAPNGTQAVYDRTADGTTHVISLKPGDVPFGSGEDARYVGAPFDGLGIAFEAKNALYLRYDDKETFEIGEGVEFAGVAEGGGRIFYVEDGNLDAFDVATRSVIEFADTAAAVVPATISADGSTAYFVSESVIPAAGTNPTGAEPQPGEENLYRSREGQIAFVGTVTERDVVGTIGETNGKTDGLGLWVRAIGPAVTPGFLGIVPARSTPDGGVFLFKSRAPLTGYDSQGHAEVYRYDSAGDVLQCLSCNPTGAAAQSDANLQSEDREGSELFSAIAWPANLRADGRRAFFESSEPLVAEDVDGLQDVYEWEDQGVGSCTRPGGCLYLVSSPQSRRNEYLWAVSGSGDDVFFLSSDLLVGVDADETPSIYDARVGGGFAEPARAECEGEGCRPHLAPPPLLPTGDTPVRGPGDNVKSRRCGKGKRKVKRTGKVR